MFLPTAITQNSSTAQNIKLCTVDGIVPPYIQSDLTSTSCFEKFHIKHFRGKRVVYLYMQI